MPTYIDPFTDFGFKRIFGSEESKPLLISFLNDLLPIEDKIVSLNFNKNEYAGMLKEDRRAIFDINCTDEKDNILYFVGILNFAVSDFNDDNYLHYGQITDRDTNSVMYDKLSFIYIELPKFKKTEAQLSNHLEKWLWFFNKLSELDEIPESFKKDIIKDAFSLSELAKMKPEKRKEYELSLKYHRDWVNTMDTAVAKGINKRNIEIAKNLLKAKVDIETIEASTGLSRDEIDSLK